MNAARILIEAGSDVNARMSNGQTPLHLAAGYGGYCDLADPDIERADPCNRQRHHPIKPEVAELVTAIIKERNAAIPPDLSATGNLPEESKPDVFLAVLEAFGNPRELYQAILARGFDLDRVDLHFSEFLRGRPRYLRMVEFLLDQGADIDAFDESDTTPLHCAVELGQPEMVELLLKRGATVSSSLDPSVSPVALALDYCKTEVATLLVQHGVAFDPSSGLYLHEAAGNGRREVVLWLLQQGTDINQVSEEGDTAILEAARNGHHEVVACLSQHRAHVHHFNQQGNGLLHAAAPWPKCLEVVLTLDLPVNQRNVTGVAPLHIAAQSGDPAAVRILIAAGAQVNIQDNNGNTPLHTIFNSDECRPDIEFPVFYELVAAGADRAIKNGEGKTAYDLATQWQYPEEYLALLNPGPDAKPADAFAWLGESKYSELLPGALVVFELEGQQWPSCEHFLHGQKTADPAVREAIRQAGSVNAALHRLRESKAKSPNTVAWAQHRDRAMQSALRAKITQHSRLHALLLSTHEALLISDSHCDSYWLERPGNSFNAIGKMLMNIRAELQTEAQSTPSRSPRR